jgi:hypothetical protein
MAIPLFAAAILLTAGGGCGAEDVNVSDQATRSTLSPRATTTPHRATPTAQQAAAERPETPAATRPSPRATPPGEAPPVASTSARPPAPVPRLTATRAPPPTATRPAPAPTTQPATPTPAAPSIVIISPADGATVEGSFSLEVRVTGVTLALGPNYELIPGAAHWHAAIDKHILPTPYDTPAATVGPLPAGPHTITVNLYLNDRDFVLVSSDRIAITVR